MDGDSKDQKEKDALEKSAMDRLLEIYKTRRIDRNKYWSRREQRMEKLPPKLGDLLNKHFRKDAEALKKMEQSRALQAWARMVGGAAAAASNPLAVEGDRMIVQVRDPLWRQQLILMKWKIVNNYRRHFPKLRLRDIFFVGETRRKGPNG